MKVILSWLAISLFSASVVCAEDNPKSIAGYGKTTWGMSVEQVLEAESPRATKLIEAEKYSKGSLGLVEINDIKVGASTFRASFLFDESAQLLKQVNLTGVDKNAGSNIVTFSSIERMLTEKYGQPTFKEAYSKATWKLEKTLVSLERVYIPSVISKVVITYKPVAAGALESRDL